MNNNKEDQNKEKEETVDVKETGSQHMATNPNPRANENIKNAPFDKEEGGSEVGSEITDGEGG